METVKRKATETRDEYISRCVKDLSDKDTEMDNTQIVAMCETSADESNFGSFEELRSKLKHKNNGDPDKRFKENKLLDKN